MSASCTIRYADRSTPSGSGASCVPSTVRSTATPASRTCHEIVEVVEAGLGLGHRGHRGRRVVALGVSWSTSRRTPSSRRSSVSASLRADGGEHGRRRVGLVGEQRLSRLGLDGDDAHLMGGDVVELAGDAQPFVGGRLRHLFGGAVAQLDGVRAEQPGGPHGDERREPVAQARVGPPGGQAPGDEDGGDHRGTHRRAPRCVGGDGVDTEQGAKGERRVDEGGHAVDAGGDAGDEPHRHRMPPAARKRQVLDEEQHDRDCGRVLVWVVVLVGDDGNGRDRDGRKDDGEQRVLHHVGHAREPPAHEIDRTGPRRWSPQTAVGDRCSDVAVVPPCHARSRHWLPDENGTRKGSGEVETQRFERLVEVMARMAGGDRAAVFTLYLEFGDHVAALMRRELRRLGVQHVEPDELDGLVLNGCLALLDHAGAWDPEGGRAAVELGGEAPGGDRRGLGGPARRPARRPRCRGRRAAPGARARARGPRGVRAARPLSRRLRPARRGVRPRQGQARDRAILLEVKLQTDAGDPSPSVTVARDYGLKPDAVRQVVKRTLDRLRVLAELEPRFAGLIELPILR